MFESAEDDILDTIMNGNWSYAVEQMIVKLGYFGIYTSVQSTFKCRIKP